MKLLSAKAALTAGVLGGVGAVAWADTVKDATFQVTSGQYHWVQNTSVGGIPISEDNTECLKPSQSQMTLSGLARKLQKSCTVDNVAKTADGYTFKLICGGKYPGEADAKLVRSEKALTITAQGSAKLLGIQAPFNVKADATYAGACTPEQLAKPDKNDKPPG